METLAIQRFQKSPQTQFLEMPTQTHLAILHPLKFNLEEMRKASVQRLVRLIFLMFVEEKLVLFQQAVGLTKSKLLLDKKI